MAFKDKEYEKQYQREWRAKQDIEARRKYHRDYQRKRRQSPEVKAKERVTARQYASKRFGVIKKQILFLYGGDNPTCVCCGESHIEFLTIDHINGGGNKERNEVGWGNQFYKWLVQQPVDHTKYRILCYNCNCYRRSIYQDPVCPHRR